jgi:hypothetical protein
MKTRLLIAVGFCCVLFALSSSWSFAHSYDRDDDGYPLRIIAYAAHPVGMLVEYTVTRPLHWLVSRPVLCEIFGHQPNPDDKYFVWE